MALLALLAGLLSVGLACDGPADEPPIVVVNRQPKGGLDVTFIVAADTHIGTPKLIERNKRQIRSMNAVEGKDYPPGIGGKAQKPRAVIIAGDLTENGITAQWKQYVSLYGLTGTEGMLKYPVYEFTGNHDRWPGQRSTPVIDGVRARRGSLYYSWEWGDLHLICLDEAPTDEGLKWLRRDLAATGRLLPVVIFLHDPLVKAFSRDPNWFTGSDEQARFAEIIKGFNIVAIFHGHTHFARYYQWKGISVYNVGSPRHYSRSYAIVHITDERLTVVEWNWDSEMWGIEDIKPMPRRSTPAVKRPPSPSSQQSRSLHEIETVPVIASLGTPRRASWRRSSRIRAIASARLARHSSIVLPCPLAPGISGQ